MLYEEGFTQNREISWLRYNERVLEEALDKTVPLFERLRFVSIFTSNLEEFFKVRVGGLLGEAEEGADYVDEKSGMTPDQQLSRIQSFIPGLLIKKDMVLSEIENELASAGIRRLEPGSMNEVERGLAFDFFRDRIKSSLGITILDRSDELPYLDEERTYLAADLDAEMDDRFGLIDIPADLPKLMSVIPEGHKDIFGYVLTEDIICMYADTLFVPFVPKDVHAINIARSAGSSAADKLISEGRLSDNLRKYLADSLRLSERQIYTTTRIDFSYLDQLWDSIPAQLKTGITYEPHVPYDQTEGMEGSIIEEVKRRDILSSYPYDSADMLLGLLREAAFSDEVSAIHITIYRLASHPKIAEYLIYAARSGKKVKVVMELRARFDEKRNLAWAERLSAAGCRVYYGPGRYKVHSKLCQIVLKDGAEKRYITNISTGNYNEKTAKQYTDFSLLTYDRETGAAAARLFRDICKENIGERASEDSDPYAPLTAAPSGMRRMLLGLIKREAGKGAGGLIFLKMNSLSDDELIEALMNASCAGCRVRLIVRGICCLLPGIEGATENVCIVNRVGRFLEHSRVYIFGEGKDELMYISSADLMTRNMDHRVELACPIRDEAIKKRIREEMRSVYMDTDKGRVLTPDGIWARKII